VKETELYNPIRRWLDGLLHDRYKRSRVQVFDTHHLKLSSFLPSKGLDGLFPECAAYDIKVDILGIVRRGAKAGLVLVECKTKPVRLLDVGQLLGYGRIVKPLGAFLISPGGASQPLETLLRTFGRYDILEYSDGRHLTIARWRVSSQDIDHSDLLPPGPVNLFQLG